MDVQVLLRCDCSRRGPLQTSSCRSNPGKSGDADFSDHRLGGGIAKTMLPDDHALQVVFVSFLCSSGSGVMHRNVFEDCANLSFICKYINALVHG